MKLFISLIFTILFLQAASQVCPEWSPSITAETSATGYPLTYMENTPLATSDGICQKALSEDCRQYTRYARGDQVFAQNFKRNLDFTYYGGRIIAYRIQWSSGWSGWYVPGINDVDSKQSTIGGVKYLRRQWAYFSDHTHSFILCK